MIQDFTILSNSTEEDERKLIQTKMGVAGLIFEPHPPNFENIYNF